MKPPTNTSTRNILFNLTLAAAAMASVFPLSMPARAEGVVLDQATFLRDYPDRTQVIDSDTNRAYVVFNAEVETQLASVIIDSVVDSKQLTADQILICRCAVFVNNVDYRWRWIKYAPQLNQEDILRSVGAADYSGVKAANYVWQGMDVTGLRDDLALRFKDWASLDNNRDWYNHSGGAWFMWERVNAYQHWFTLQIPALAGTTAAATDTNEFAFINAEIAAYAALPATPENKKIRGWLQQQRDLLYLHMQRAQEPLPTPTPAPVK